MAWQALCKCKTSANTTASGDKNRHTSPCGHGVCKCKVNAITRLSAHFQRQGQVLCQPRACGDKNRHYHRLCLCTSARFLHGTLVAYASAMPSYILCDNPCHPKGLCSNLAPAISVPPAPPRAKMALAPLVAQAISPHNLNQTK